MLVRCPRVPAWVARIQRLTLIGPVIAIQSPARARHRLRNRELPVADREAAQIRPDQLLKFWRHLDLELGITDPASGLH
jgi:hypothetical protein